MRGRIGDRELTLLLDTGFEQSALALIGAKGDDLEHLEFDLGGVRAGPLHAGLLLAPLGVDGVVGADVLMQVPQRLDARARETELRPASGQIAQENAIPLQPITSSGACIDDREERGPAGPFALLVEAQVEGRSATFVLDTGAEITFIRSSLFDPLTGDRAVLGDVRVGSGFAGTFLARATRARTLSVGNQSSHAALVLTSSAVDAELDRLTGRYGRQVDGFLGWSFLREYEVTLEGAALVLERFDTQAHWTREFVGIGIYRAPSYEPPGIKVEGFLDPSPAKASGVQIGDVIVKVDGKPVSPADPLPTSSGEVELQLLRAGQPVTLRVAFGDLLPDP